MPSHLIYGKRLKTLPDEVDEPDDAMNPNSLSARFRYLTTRLTHFWNRWRKEYLASLCEFRKCNFKRKERVVTVGEAVVVYEDDKKRGSGKWAFVEGLVIGRDDLVRGAKVRVITKGKPVRLSTPVQRLYPRENGTQKHPQERSHLEMQYLTRGENQKLCLTRRRVKEGVCQEK